ncbi:sugar phosphate isomerase/epimerase [Novosphingobium sp. PhB165]|uniref:sugar phosphate isomerase/epimerase family protein n=1 Tax=Novosphingobium sp. PhB165 TaxID=2485105 RepID=UPI00104FF775|nr:sugar phosphate isomerase/epimerase [Novosphingobium sp. PhB165]TCM17073.1 sugar phosphate isomerase/epimerase [Novosphingobium sp. PhB165]
MHPRVSLHQVAMVDRETGPFLDFCSEIGVQHVTLVSPRLLHASELHAAREAVQHGRVRIGCINHPFALQPDLERHAESATGDLIRVIDMAADLGAPSIYLITGGRGALLWEQAAERFVELLAPCRDHAAARNVALLVENASPLTVDIHIAHTLPDALRLARLAGIGLCVDLHACWVEAHLREKLAEALPLAGLVQVSDHVPGDRTTPCRAVPGDGAVPLETILRDVLDLGYTGLFDLELVGPRIEAEGPAEACTRAAHALSNILTRLGA